MSGREGRDGRDGQEGREGRLTNSRLAGVLALLFLIRLAFGLASEFWFEDERQIYLIGLKFFTTGEWPYFGPDVVYTQTQIPGALQGLLVGGPLFLAPLPEAPFVLLNLLSLGALWLLAWYIARRVPQIPAWFLWPWIFLSPWTLSMSTHVLNPSYVLTGAVLFFVSVLETMPSTAIGVMPKRLAFFLVGFGFFWVAQLTMAFPVLVPFVIAVLWFAVAGGRRAAIEAVVWLAIGSLASGSTLIPTLIKYSTAAGETGANVTFDPSNFGRVFEIVARFFSFASFELPRFLGANTAQRVEFLKTYWWAAPFAVVAGVVGLLQPFVLLGGLFTRKVAGASWTPIRLVTAAALVTVYVSFFFSVKEPSSHTFYVVLPVVLIYAAYCWNALLQMRPIQWVALALIVSGAITYLALGIDNLQRRSLYTNRGLVVQAIQEKNDRLLGDRRQVIWGTAR